MGLTGTPSLFQVIRETASQVPLPPNASMSFRTLWDIFDGDYEMPGTGSDHTGFAHHAGIPIAYMGISSVNGVYNSVYHRYLTLESTHLTSYLTFLRFCVFL